MTKKGIFGGEFVPRTSCFPVGQEFLHARGSRTLTPPVPAIALSPCPPAVADNTYNFCDADPFYDEASADLMLLFRPLFITGWYRHFDIILRIKIYIPRGFPSARAHPPPHYIPPLPALAPCDNNPLRYPCCVGCLLVHAIRCSGCRNSFSF